MVKQEENGKERRSFLLGHGSTRLGFILAVTGSAVGLGNIWKFPYIAGQNGGGAFVLVYLACVALIALPVLMSEILIGRRGRRSPVATMALLGEEEGSSRRWQWVAIVAVFAGILILSYYSVVAGWTLAYVPKALSGIFRDASAQDAVLIFKALTDDWQSVAVAHTVFMAATIALIARGYERFVEKAVSFVVPALLLLLILLAVRGMSSSGFAEGISYLFKPDFSMLTWRSVLHALGQAFFSLSLGIGAVMAYGAYLSNQTSITKTASAVVVADTAIAVLAAIVIFPAVFTNGLNPADGPGLVFVALPLAFHEMAGGVFFATSFFVLLSFAALTSALGLLEPGVAWVVEHSGRTRSQAAMLVGGVIWATGFATIFSFNELAGFRLFGGTLFENIDYLTSNILLPLGGFFITVFAAWVMCRNSTADELGGAGNIYRLWRFFSRWVVPVGILVICAGASGVIA